MNHPSIKLVTYTADAEKLVCAAAKLCYASDPAVMFDISGEEIKKFLSRLRNMRHLSPFEHASYTFLLEGVSRALTHQLVRHRLASYSQRSQRYVSHDTFDYIIPPSLKGKTVETDEGTVDGEAYFSDFMAQSAETYRKLIKALGDEHESAIEDARYVLPNATETKIMVTMNARELFHFFSERLCNRAQWEIRTAADEMLRLVRGVSPVIFRGIGPKCVQLGYCPEGKLSCGHIKEMKKRYK
jgi:thymidylate synthase (FAD)